VVSAFGSVANRVPTLDHPPKNKEKTLSKAIVVQNTIKVSQSTKRKRKTGEVNWNGITMFE